MSYSLNAFAAMMGDDVRVQAYNQALARIITPDSVVLDLGAGTGIFSLLACLHGARVVYAVETEGIIQLARELAAANNFTDRIHFIQDHSTCISLPEKANVLVCDLRGSLPPHGTNLVSIIEAKKRLLQPGARILPEQDLMRVAIAEAGELYVRLTRPWGDHHFDLNLEPMRKQLCHQWSRFKHGSGNLLSQAQTWFTLNYASIQNPNLAGRVECCIDKLATGHGLFVWFDACIGSGIGFSGLDREGPKVYGRAFFPWPEPLSLEEGDQVDVEIRADLLGGDYIWRWTTEWYAGGTRAKLKKRFEQNSFLGEPLSLQSLQQRTASANFVLNNAGLIRRAILNGLALDQDSSAIAGLLLHQFPAQITDESHAKALVEACMEKFATFP